MQVTSGVIAEIMITTPSCLCWLLDHRHTNFRRLTYVTVDDADDQICQGFSNKLRSIESKLRADRQLMVCSKTWSKELNTLAHEISSNVSAYLCVGVSFANIRRSESVSVQHLHDVVAQRRTVGIACLSHAFADEVLADLPSTRLCCTSSRRKLRSRRELRLWSHIYLNPDLTRNVAAIPKLFGRVGKHMKQVAELTGSKIRLRGRGSGQLEIKGCEANTGEMLTIILNLLKSKQAYAAYAVFTTCTMPPHVGLRLRLYCYARVSSALTIIICKSPLLKAGRERETERKRMGERHRERERE